MNAPRLPWRKSIILPHFSHFWSVSTGGGFMISLPSLSIEYVVLQSGYPEQAKKGPRRPTFFISGLPHFSQFLSISSGTIFEPSGLSRNFIFACRVCFAAHVAAEAAFADQHRRAALRAHFSGLFRLELLSFNTVLRESHRFHERRVKILHNVDPGVIALRDFIQTFFKIGGKIQIDNFTEMLFQQVGHIHAQIRGE